MAVAVCLLSVLVLWSSVFNTNLARGATIVGSNVSTPARVSILERFYLNTARPASCNGTITRLMYCYYGREDNNRNTYQLLVALYRPEPGNNSYQRITNTVSIIKRTPLSQVPPADALLPEFSCDSMELEENVQVLQGDVIGACIYDTLISIRRLDVVSLNDNVGYRMLYNSANDEDCDNRVLPEVVGRSLEQTSRLRVLHIFAEILPTDMEIRNDIVVTTMPSNSQDQFITITAVIIGGLAIIVIVMITVTAVACFIAAKKWKQRNNREYSYMANNLSYNTRSGRIDMDDENERNSDTRPPSTVPYYDYITDGTPKSPRSAGSRERVLSSSDSSDFMVQNRAYRLQQVTDLYSINSDASVSMVQNRAYL